MPINLGSHLQHQSNYCSGVCGTADSEQEKKSSNSRIAIYHQPNTLDLVE